MEKFNEKQLETIKKLEEKYKIHPLIFQRSIEKAKDEFELFDILDTIPESFPLMWENEKRIWVTVSDFLEEK